MRTWTRLEYSGRLAVNWRGLIEELKTTNNRVSVCLLLMEMELSGKMRLNTWVKEGFGKNRERKQYYQGFGSEEDEKARIFLSQRFNCLGRGESIY